ncbi:MAG: nickel-dependent lactate racemase [Planctomycetota bacterium]|nr:nickel-dependent lactate racemase [Planctomycetota bacterium]
MNLLLSFQHRGLELNVPGGVEVRAARPVEPEAAALKGAEALGAALDGAGFAGLLAGRRRPALVIGDFTWPAAYAEVLPELARRLIEAGIRPTRVRFLAWPGTLDRVLGRAAIRRYGERVVGEHELRAWKPKPGGQPDAEYAAADLRIAVFPDLPGALDALPAFDLALLLAPGRGPETRIAGVRSLPALAQKEQAVEDGARSAFSPRERVLAEAEAYLTTGGGAPNDATLEEALLALRFAPRPADAKRSLALAFHGGEGLGSGLFARDLDGLLEQAEEALARGEALNLGADLAQSTHWDPAAALASALCAWGRVILFAPELFEHEDAELLGERLAESPRLAERLHWVGEADELWAKLAEAHGPKYAIQAEPLGWRGSSVFPVPGSE